MQMAIYVANSNEELRNINIIKDDTLAAFKGLKLNRVDGTHIEASTFYDTIIQVSTKLRKYIP